MVLSRATTSRRASAFVVMLSVTALVLAGLGQRSADADHQTVTAVQGSAFGYHAYNFSLFGGAQPDVGPTPIVNLAPDASNSPQAATAAEGQVTYGPATIFTSGPITVTTEGGLGSTGVVTSSANVQDVNRGGSEAFDADNVASTCTASEAGVSGTTTITNGTIRTHAQAADHPEGVVQIPTNPSPGFTVEGHVHIGDSQDNFRYVFNEQIVNPDGSITVNAVHAYFLGPIAVGELIIGQVVCGVTTEAITTTTTVPTTTTTIPEDITRAAPAVVRGAHWYLRDTADSGAADIDFVYGNRDDQKLMGDWDGDGTKTPAVYRDGTFYFRNSNDSGVADYNLDYDPGGAMAASPSMVASPEVAVAGDWNGDGVDGVGVFDNGRWNLFDPGETEADDEEFTFGYGNASDRPIAGDWDGDGSDTPGVVRGATWYLRNENTTGVADDTFVYGNHGDIPVPADFDGDGTDTPTVVRAARWYIRNSNSAGIADRSFHYGNRGDIPLVW